MTSPLPNTPDEGISQPGSGPAPQEKRRLILFVISMLLIGAACLAVTPSAMKAARQWLAHRHLPEVRQSIRRQDWRAAVLALKNARRWAPEDPEVLRASIALLSRAEADPRTIIQAIRQLQAVTKVTSDELALLGELHAKMGDISEARALYAQLPDDARESRPALHLQASILEADGFRDRALEVRRETWLTDLDNPESLAQLAATDLSGTDPSRRTAMVERLWKIVRSESPAVITAVKLLAGTNHLTITEAKELRGIIEKGGIAPPERESARLAVLSAWLRLNPHLRTDLIDEELSRWKNRKPSEVTPLARWLADEHEYARILRIMPASTVARYTDLLPPYVTALRSEEKWNDLNTLLTSGGIDPAFSKQKTRLWLAEAQSHLEYGSGRARQTLAQVFENAGRGDDLSSTLEAAKLAEQLHDWAFAQRCYEGVATKHRHTAAPMLAKVYEMAELQRDGSEMLATCVKLLELRPDNVQAMLQKLYLQSLLGIELEVAHETVQSLVLEGSTERIDKVHLVRALSIYRSGLKDGIRDEILKISHPDSMTAGERAVYAGLLHQSGGAPANVFQIAERIPRSLLLPEEAAFLKRAL